MLIGYFDYFIFVILIFLNIKYWKTNYKTKKGCVFGVLLFGFLLPFISMIVELETVGQWVDSFEVVYTYLRFPMYWIIGVFQIVVILIKQGVKNKE